MPQLELGSFASQIFWLFVSFMTLYLLMSYVYLPRMRDVLQNRKTKIAQDLSSAEKNKEEAALSRSDFTQADGDARNKAHELIAEAEATIKEKAAEKHAELDEKLEKQFSEAEDNIAKVKQALCTELEEKSTDIAQYVLRELTTIDATSDDVRVAVSKNLREAA